MSYRWTPIAITKAPMAMKAPWPSEIWPLKPVRMFNPRMAIAKIRA